MDRGPCWVTVHGVTQSDITEVTQHIHRHMQLTPKYLAHVGTWKNTYTYTDIYIHICIYVHM